MKSMKIQPQHDAIFGSGNLSNAMTGLEMAGLVFQSFNNLEILKVIFFFLPC